MADATGTTEAEWAVWRAFLAAHARLSLEVDSRLRQAFDLSQGEYGTLAAIREQPGRRLRVKQIAELLGWERSRVSHLVTRMEQRGLVRREPCPDDARATDIVITPRGTTTLLGAVRGHAADLHPLFFDQMSPQERVVVQRVLDRILAHLPESDSG